MPIEPVGDWYQKIRPLVVGDIKRIVLGGVSARGSSSSGGDIGTHALDGAYHAGTLSDDQAPQFLKADGTRSLTGHLSVAAGITIDGVDLDAHAGDPAAHHSPVSAGNGITVLGQQVSAKAGDGVDVGAGGVSVDVSDLVGAGLGEDGSNNLVLGTPSTLAHDSSNLVATGTHGHAVAASDNPGVAASLLKSNASGGLTLQDFQSDGDIRAMQSLYAGGSNLRVIHHTHDYPHVHVAINPRAGWNLDEQFGLDVDDNLLVRGWIVGKHALQVEGAVLLAHYDGPEPFETDFTGNPTGHMGQVATETGSVVYRPGKFGKAAQVAPYTYNYVRNPSFETNLNYWSTSDGITVTRSVEQSRYGAYAAKCVSSGDNQSYYADVSGLTGNTQYTVSGWLYIESGSAIVQLFDGGGFSGGQTIGTYSATGEWIRWSAQRTTGSGVTGVRIWIREATDISTWYVDGVQVEAGELTPFADGGLGTGHEWVSTAHASASRRYGGLLAYGTETTLQREAGSIALWAYPVAISGSNQYAFAHYNANGRIYLLINSSGAWSGRVGDSSSATTAAATPEAWQHVALTWDAGTASLYVDGALIDTWSYSGLDALSGTFGVGAFADNSQHLNGYIDDLGLFKRALDADEIRAIYESNAPIFAETSTWHWRSANNLVWADAEGMWMFDQDGNSVLGVVGVDGKAWGGRTNDAGDLLIGSVATGKYLLWDNSANDLSLRGTITIEGGSGIASLSDAGALATADNLDQVPEGSNYGKVLKTSISAGKILLSQAEGNLDNVEEGSLYGKVLKTSINAGKILLSEAEGNLDNIQPGSTYGLVRQTILGAGYIKIGTGTKDSTLDGWHFDEAEIVGQLDGVDQVRMGTDGRIHAGGDAVRLGADGIWLDATRGKFSGGSLDWYDGSVRKLSMGTNADLGAVVGAYIESPVGLNISSTDGVSIDAPGNLIKNDSAFFEVTGETTLHEDVLVKTVIEVMGDFYGNDYGSVALKSGTDTNTGYIEWRMAGGIRQGYMGWDFDELLLRLEERNFYVRGDSGRFAYFDVPVRLDKVLYIRESYNDPLIYSGQAALWFYNGQLKVKSTGGTTYTFNPV